MSTADEALQSDLRPTGIGPGERLQAARIQKGLSLEDVASRMHLSANILEAIEENSFDEITAPIFVKGYLRAYARIVELDEDEMIEQYAKFYSGDDPPISSTSNMAPELSIADARIRWTTYVVIVMLAVLLAAWWWNKEQSQTPPVSLGTQGDAASGQAAAEVASSAIEAATEFEPLPAENASDATELAPVAAAQPLDPVTAKVAPESAVVGPVVAESAIAEPAANIESTIETAAAETASVVADEPPDESVAAETAALVASESADELEPQPTAENDSNNQTTQLAPTGSDKLEMIVHADSWADIKDATGYQLVYDLLRAEQKLELTGSAPFAVFLGNGHGVEIRLNGEEFNFFSRIRDDNTARIKIGG